MLKQLNGFKVFYICWLAFLVIELILIVFGLSFTPLLSCLWFDFLFLVLFFHLWSIFYKKREFKFFHLILQFLSVILAFFIWLILQVSFTDSADTIISPIRVFPTNSKYSLPFYYGIHPSNHVKYDILAS